VVPLDLVITCNRLAGKDLKLISGIHEYIYQTWLEFSAYFHVDQMHKLLILRNTDTQVIDLIIQ
jgi:hypothetical protein